MADKELKEIEKTIGINLDIIDNTLKEQNIYLERIVDMLLRIAIASEFEK